MSSSSIGQSVDRRHIGAIVRSGCDSRRIGAIGWLMYRMHIGTIIVCVGSSTVPATGSFGWQYNASNGVVFRRQIGTESCHRVGSQAYQLQQLSGLAAADTGSSFFVLVALPA